MRIFLAGPHTYTGMIAELLSGGTGQITVKQGPKTAMKLFLAGIESRHWIVEEAQEKMKLYLAGVAPWQSEGIYNNAISKYRPFILESFYYSNDDTERLIPYYGDFMLDSGAFTFCGTGGYDPNKFEEYLERYADFINRHNVEKFFELDVDSITGYDKVLEYRRKLERLTNKPVIPVWHISRGKEEFIRHCDEYPYIALGGYVAAIQTNDPRNKMYIKSYPWFINEAHKRGKKIHGLGFTMLSLLPKYHFDSVDSTAWTTGNRFGYLYYFDGETMKKRSSPKGCRIADPRTAALNNYVEWIKFQQYAERNY